MEARTDTVKEVSVTCTLTSLAAVPSGTKTFPASGSSSIGWRPSHRSRAAAPAAAAPWRGGRAGGLLVGGCQDVLEPGALCAARQPQRLLQQADALGRVSPAQRPLAQLAALEHVLAVIGARPRGG